MITPWLLYGLVVASLLSVVAFAAERAAQALRLPTRMIWAAAFVASLVWPAAAAVAPHVRVTPVASAPMLLDVQRVSAVATGAVGSQRAAVSGRALIVAWVMASALLSLRLVLLMRTIRGRRAEWRRVRVDNLDVCISRDVGPAVVGLRAMDVVLPEWLLSLDTPLRALVLTHEAEHREARDPYLLVGAALGLALAPWNLPLWWQARRLRLAVELDCDARVLRRHPRTDRYGMLLLTIAQRRTLMPMLFSPMLSEPISQLERRIEAMQEPARRGRALRAFASIGCAIVGFAAACELQSPDAPTAANANVQPAAPQTVKQPYFAFQVEKQAELAPGNTPPRYPDILRRANIEGQVLAQFVVDTNGRVDGRRLKILNSSHELFSAAVRENLLNYKFVPAEVGGRKVKQLVQMPFQFNLAK